MKKTAEKNTEPETLRKKEEKSLPKKTKEITEPQYDNDLGGFREKILKEKKDTSNQIFIEQK